MTETLTTPNATQWVQWSKTMKIHDKTVQDLRAEGYAVIVWTPEELGDCSTRTMEDSSIEHGSVIIELMNAADFAMGNSNKGKNND